MAWDANVIGNGSVSYGIGALDHTLTDSTNTTNHAFTLTGLQPGATYQYKVSNRHAIDGGTLAELSGQFQTQPGPGPAPTGFDLAAPHAVPRTVDPGQVSTLSIRAQTPQGVAVPGAVVQFAIDPSSQGGGSFGGGQATQATTDANGIASVQFTAGNRGNVHVNVTAQGASNAHKITVVVSRT